MAVSRPVVAALALFAAVALAAYQRPLPPEAPPEAPPADGPPWENLQVLSDTLTRDELMAEMNRFGDALGVNCAFCHVRTSDGMNFPSDDRGHKRIAREMIRLERRVTAEVRAIPGLGHHGTPEVTCWTCHRGEARPPADSTAHAEH